MHAPSVKNARAIALHEPAEQVIDLRSLRLMSTIAAQGSVTAAARELRVTQPALSHQLRQLEFRLRTPLFIRTAKRMVPTMAGEELAIVARQVLSLVTQFEHRARTGEFSSTMATVRIVATCHTTYHWFPGLVKEMKGRWPEVDVRIGPEHTTSPLAALRDGALDLAIVPQRVADRRVAFHALFDDELVVLVPAAHRFARDKCHTIAAGALEGERIVLDQQPAAMPCAIVTQILEPAGVATADITRVHLTDAIIEMVRAGLGITLLAGWAASAYVTAAAGSLHAIRLTASGHRGRWYAATRADEPEPPFLRDLLEFLRKHVGGRAVATTPRRVVTA